MNAQPAGEPVTELYHGQAKEQAALLEKGERIARAQSEPFPGPMADAFLTDPPALHGFTLEPVRMSTIQILKKIKSPLLDVVRIMREEMTREDGADMSTPELARAAHLARMARANERMETEIKTEDETFSGTIYCFVHPIAEVRALLKKGLEIFNETAQREISDKLSVTQVVDLQRAVSAHYSASFSTIVNYAAPKGKDDGSFFTPPPAAPKTG